jgi:hypothetical protein
VRTLHKSSPSAGYAVRVDRRAVPLWRRLDRIITPRFALEDPPVYVKFLWPERIAETRGHGPTKNEICL